MQKKTSISISFHAINYTPCLTTSINNYLDSSKKNVNIKITIKHSFSYMSTHKQTTFAPGLGISHSLNFEP